MHAPEGGIREYAQRANRPRGLAISILELTKIFFRDSGVRHDRGVTRRIDQGFKSHHDLRHPSWQ
jgi:hypothetical protein